jgi:hypothetical protein
LLKKEYDITRSLRTVQRHIRDLVEDKKLVLVQSSGRELSYATLESKTSSSKLIISQHFLSRFWDELFNLRDILNSQNQDIHSRDIFDRLRSLVKMLPKTMKDQIMPSIDGFWKFSDAELAELQEQWNREIGPAQILTVNGIPFGEYEQARHDRGISIVENGYRKRLENLIDIVSTVLHRAIEEAEKNE